MNFAPAALKNVNIWCRLMELYTAPAITKYLRFFPVGRASGKELWFYMCTEPNASSTHVFQDSAVAGILIGQGGSVVMESLSYGRLASTGILFESLRL
jgi:hypothetical protein